MGRREKEFPSEVREKLLLWCDRHCCLCKKACGVLIDVHHIVPASAGGTDDEDNAIPLCFDCHGEVGHYNSKHPKGIKFRPAELKKRREQVYEEFTRHLVPAVNFRVQQEHFSKTEQRLLPDIGFFVHHLGNGPPVRLRIKVDVYVDGSVKNHSGSAPLYTGRHDWHLNPHFAINGHFPAVDAVTEPKVDVRAGVYVIVIDVFGRPHSLLPVTYVYDRPKNSWWLDVVDPKSVPARTSRALANARGLRDVKIGNPKSHG